VRCAAVLMLSLLGGCASVGPLPDAASVQLPVRYSYAPEQAADVPLAALLPNSDAGFVKLAEQARINAPTLAAALARVDAARAGLDRAGANRKPNINSSNSIAVNRASGAQTAPGADRDTFQIVGATTASWDIDLFGGLRASGRAAASRLDAAGADASAVRLALDCEIAVAVTDYRDAAARETIVQRDIADAKDLVRLTGIRAKAGIVPGFDVVRAESLLRDAQVRLAPFLADKANAVGRLVALTATGTDDVLAMLGTENGRGELPQLRGGVPSQLLRNRPDIQAAEYRLAAAKSDVAVAAAARFPKFSITGTLGLFALALGDVFDGSSSTASLGAGITGPLFDFGRIKADIKANEASAQEAFENYRGSVYQALGEVESAFAGYTAARNASDAALARLETDRDALSIARERYRLGIADFLTVIDAQRTLNVARQASESNIAGKARAAITLYRVLGGTPQGQAK
jgi:NodT family efflux transporter outer membrane factor (OMF) lipoprotein